MTEAGERCRPGAAEDDPTSELLTGLAHDVNNLLGVVIGGLGYVQEELQAAGASPDSLEAVDDALSAGREAAELMHKAVAAAGLQPARPESVDVPRLLEQLAEELRRTLELTVQLALPSSRPVRARVDARGLESALRELLANATEAVGERGTLTLTCALADSSQGSRSDVSARGSDFVEIAVEDDGVGMNHETLKAADRPFFTTRGRGRHGLGLCVAAGFARQAGGRLLLESEPGQSTRAVLVLPVAP